MINTAFSIIDNFSSSIGPIFRNVLDILYLGTLIFLGFKLIVNALYVIFPGVNTFIGDRSRLKNFLINKRLDEALQNEEINILPVFLKNCVLVQGSVIVGLILFKFLIFGGVRF